MRIEYLTPEERNRQRQVLGNGAPKSAIFHAGEIPEWVRMLVSKIEIHLSRRNFDAAVDVIRRQESRIVARKRAKMAGKGRTNLTEEEKLELPLASIGLSVRIVNALEKRGVLKVRALVAMRPREFFRIPNLGMRAFQQCVDSLCRIGIVSMLRAED